MPTSKHHDMSPSTRSECPPTRVDSMKTFSREVSCASPLGWPVMSRRLRRARSSSSSPRARARWYMRSEEHTSELQSHSDLVCRPRRSPPFPYTTLFRSHADLEAPRHVSKHAQRVSPDARGFHEDILEGGELRVAAWLARHEQEVAACQIIV